MINDLCIRDLAAIIGGSLQLGSMPPLGGELEPICRVVTDTRHVKPGDVFWGLAGERSDGSLMAEDAFARGALGVVVAGRHVEPWAGKFTIRVADVNKAFGRLTRWMRRHNGHARSATTSAAGRHQDAVPRCCHRS